MKCPFCRTEANDVYNTRSTRFGSQIWRRRRCSACQQPFTTYETADLGFLRVIRPHKRFERYSRAQLFSSVYTAFPDITGKAATIDAVTETIEAKLLDLKSANITTEQITGITLATLKHFEPAAFLRYLSSHADLASPARLKRELKKY